MTLPAELTYVTVTGQVMAGTDRQVAFKTPSWLIGLPFVRPFGVQAVIETDGSFSVQLPATDDPAWAPVNWTYQVTVKVDGQTFTGSLAVPIATMGELPLAPNVIPDEPFDPGTVAYILASARSAAGGVAGLDADGDVINAAGEKVTGGGGGGGTPSNTVVSETSYGQSADDGASSTYSRGDHTHGTPAAPTWSQVTSKPSTFTPATHAASHADGGADEISIDGSQVTSGTVATARLSVGTGSSNVAAGDHTHGGGGSGITPGFASGYRTAGNLAGTNSTGAWEIISGFTMTIPAAAGDRITFNLSCLVDHNSSRTDIFDIAVIVSAAAVRCASSNGATPATDGLPEQSNSTVQYGPGSFRMAFTAVSGDISGGNITFAVLHKGPGTGSLLAGVAYPLRWDAVNLKQ